MQLPMSPFTWGANGEQLTPEQVARRRAIADHLVGQGIDTSPVGHWTQGAARVANALVGAIQRRRADTAERKGLQSATDDFAAATSSFGAPSYGSSLATDAAGEIADTGPAQPIDMTGNDVYGQFMGTVRGGVNNPYALAAIAATGKAESGFSPGNVNRTWSDPSQSGQPGTAGGILSWRGPRYQALAATGDLSPAGQAKFFLQENPQLIQALNNAGSVEEAMSLMNNAWKFAGYDRPGGEAANRLGYAKGFLPTFGTDVAAMTPNGAIDAIAPTGGLSDEVAEFQQTPEYRQQFPGMGEAAFDGGRFGDPAAMQPVQGRDGLATALAANDSVAAGQEAIAGQTNGIQQQFQGSQQLTSAQGGIVPALNEGVPASRDQIAQALALGQQKNRSSGINPAIIRALGNPYLNPGQRTIAELLLKQQMEAMDPSRQVDIEYRRAQIDAMRNRRQDLINAGDGRLYDPQSRQWIIAPDMNEGNGAFRFGGNSVEAQALNGLMDSGQLTPEQAQQLGAGKTITGSNGEIIFLTPQGVFGSTPDGKTQRLSNGASAETAGTGETSTGTTGRNFQITEPKVTIDERKAMGFADRMRESGTLIDENEKAGLNVKDQFVRGNDWIPDFAENWMVSNEFQKFDQARRNFVNAQLRRESGAVISDEEFDNANKQYFPQPGDTEEVMKQKADNRRTVISSMARDAGPTYGGGANAALDEARKAIAAGANRDAVVRRLRENGINPEGL